MHNYNAQKTHQLSTANMQFLYNNHGRAHSTLMYMFPKCTYYSSVSFTDPDSHLLQIKVCC
jgi:hypothetical protein